MKLDRQGKSCHWQPRKLRHQAAGEFESFSCRNHQEEAGPLGLQKPVDASGLETDLFPLNWSLLLLAPEWKRGLETPRL